jgi:hypothetical protein
VPWYQKPGRDDRTHLGQRQAIQVVEQVLAVFPNSVVFVGQLQDAVH